MEKRKKSTQMSLSKIFWITFARKMKPKAEINLKVKNENFKMFIYLINSFQIVVS